ncbi:MAG: glutaredoxin 3 [Methylococcales bacterium]|jgi:glutaredoxin 3|nr:glutaredoxin 3 [Methylococcales bacterium]MBT7442830.1 glutaredoxin 3 [Methylococcales bacterium]
MANVVIYLTPFCPYCVRAIQLLNYKQVKFTEIRVDTNMEQRHKMERKSKRTSVPQIFIDDKHIGGYDEMAALDRSNKLDPLLGL